MKIELFRCNKEQIKSKLTKSVIKKFFVLLGTILAFVILGAYFCDLNYNTERNSYKRIHPAVEFLGYNMEEGDVIEQPFSFDGIMRGVELCIGTHAKEVDGFLTIEVWQNNLKLLQQKLDLSEVTDGEAFEFLFDYEIEINKGDAAMLRIVAQDLQDPIAFAGENYILEEEGFLLDDFANADAAVDGQVEEEEIIDPAEEAVQELIKASKETNDDFYEASLNGVPMQAGIALRLMGYSHSLVEARQAFITVTIFLCLAVVVLEIVLLFFNLKIEQIFLLCAIILSFFYQFVTIPISAGDEDAHFEMTYYYSDLLLGRDSKQELIELSNEVQSGNEGIKLFELPHFLSRDNYLGTLSLMNDESVNVFFNGRSINVTAISYLPGILGLTLGRVLSLTFMQSVYLGRFFANAVYIVLCYYGIKKIPGYKTMLALISLLPLSLNSGASYSYDSLLLGGAILFTGFYFELSQKNEEITKKDKLLLLLCILLLTSGKGIYIIMIPMLIFLPAVIWGGKLKKKLYLTAFFSISALSFVLNMSAVLINRGELVSDEGIMQTSIIWKEPIRFIFLCINTIISQFDTHLQGMLGGYLGGTQFRIPFTLSVIVLLLMIASILSTPHNDTLKLDTEYRVGGILLFLAMYGISMAAALNWTSAKATVIAGVQGRYLLEVLPFFLLAFSGFKSLSLKKNIDRFLFLGIIWINAMALLITLDNILT